MSIDVLIVEDEPAHLERYLRNLALDADMRVVGLFSQGRPAMSAIAALAPRVALVDLGLPDISGFDVIAAFRAESPATDVLVVSVFGSEYHLLTAIERGATGYLLKDSGPMDFNAAIRAITAGESPISPSLARHLLRRCVGMVAVNPSPAPEDLDLLSLREIAILEAVARGHSMAEIATQRYISPHTVKTHIKNIYHKLQVHSREQALRAARQRGLIQT